MKNLVVLFAVVFVLSLLSHPSLAQIRNGSFEDWPDFAPLDPDWWTSDDGIYFLDCVTISNDAYHGSKAAKLEVLEGPYGAVPPFLYSFEDGGGHLIDQRYDYATGFYKFFPESDGDSLEIEVKMLIAYTEVGGGRIFVDSSSTYKSFHVPITYPGSEIPNNVTVAFAIDGPSYFMPTVGSWALVDSVSIGPVATSVEPEATAIPKSFSLSQNYPNPFNPVTNIRFSILEPSDLNLEIYNIRGQRVKTLVDDHVQAGDHVVQWDSRDANGRAAAAGIYFYRLQVDDRQVTNKMLLLR
jgi:hypothetical protein